MGRAGCYFARCVVQYTYITAKSRKGAKIMNEELKNILSRVDHTLALDEAARISPVDSTI